MNHFRQAIAIAFLFLTPLGRIAAQDASITVRTSEPRIRVTEEHLRTAFQDTATRRVLAGARVARLQQDSALISYDTRAYQRMSINLRLTDLGRNRLAYRVEGASRITWHRDLGAKVDIEGARDVAPIIGNQKRATDTSETAPRDFASVQLPYFPGSEPLWIGSDIAQADIDAESIIHPLASGAEAYYKYALRDSAQLTLPDGKVIQIVELVIRPREPKWNMIVGSFWFDKSSYRLVRAVYRLAVPLDIWSLPMEDSSVGTGIARFFVNPLRGTVSSITVEYGLYETRFWLPRLRTAQGNAQVSFMRVPFEFQQTYDYQSVNGTVDMQPVPITAQMVRADSLALRDSLAELPDSASKERARQLTQYLAADLAAASSDELQRLSREGDTLARQILRERAGTQRRLSACDTAASVTRYSRTENRAVRIMTTATCNDSLLINSPRLPSSIFTSSDELFGETDKERLRDLLDMGLQAGLAPQRPILHYGLGDGMMRYNRIEGLSPALGVTQALGAGLSVAGQIRVGLADKRTNGELSVSRTNGAQTYRLGGFQRLVASNDWGTPLAFGASLQALLFGRDEGFYYRATGAELVMSGNQGINLEMRLYGERHRTARVATQFSIANSFGDREFAGNILAEEGEIFGASFRAQLSHGENPERFRILATFRGENGIGDFNFARGMFDATASHGIFRRVAVALTLSAGNSTGQVPLQRQFALGGTQSVRGQRAGTMFGDAFWMWRAEIGNSEVGARRIFFADFGWAGPRNEWRHQSRPMSGVGIGWSLLDGMIRMDLARGLYPGKVWRFASYFEARF